MSASLVHASQLPANWESISEGAERGGPTPSSDRELAETTEKARREALRPWELHGAMGVTVDDEVRPQVQ